MTNKNFMLQGATKLSKSEMKNVKGGIPAAEYCATLREIIHHNELSEGAREGAGYGWNRAGCGRFYNDVVL
ncbi:MAG: hypothetical protein Q4G63_07355 [Bacteroidia bacterium]|nr:hypothetical protein [Bacteroidia bacterium]